MTQPRGLLYAIATGALVCGALVVLLALRSDHSAVPPAVVVLTVFASLSFVGSGLAALWHRPENRFGWLLIACGFAFFGAALPAANWPPLFTFGLLVSPLYAPVLLHTVVAFPRGRIEGGLAMAAVVLAYLDLIPLQVGHVLLTDPDRWLDCECPESLALVSDQQRASDVISFISIAVVGSILVTMVIVVLARRWRGASAPLRRVLAPFLAVGSASILVLLVGYALDATVSGRLGTVIVWIGFVGLALVPIAFLAGLLRSRLARAAVAQLVVELQQAGSPGDVRDALARALGDPSLALAYWLPDEARYVSAEGTPLDLPAGDGRRRVRTVENEGERVAALVYDAALDDERELVDAVSAAGAMALENARLQAEVRTQVAELRKSRARIVEAGDVERRRLERNLHDGAQQRLVALGLALGLVEKRLEEDPTSAGRMLAEAKAELAQGLEELRELARGIHPAALARSGLAGAVADLAGRSPVPVSVDVRLKARPAEVVEVAAYFVISEALTNVAKYSQAAGATVAVRQSADTLVVDVTDDGIGGAELGAGSGLQGLADRVSGLGGRLHVWSPPGEGTRLRAEIPCR